MIHFDLSFYAGLMAGCILCCGASILGWYSSRETKQVAKKQTKRRG